MEPCHACWIAAFPCMCKCRRRCPNGKTSLLVVGLKFQITGLLDLTAHLQLVAVVVLLRRAHDRLGAGADIGHPCCALQRR